MSTIKSSDEHLTLNADGSSKDIKFQANGVEKASISSAGAFTSTTIDATALTGDLPAISGASLTGVLPLAGGTMTGNLFVESSASANTVVRSKGTAADGYRHGFEAVNGHTGGETWSMFSTNNSDGVFSGGKLVFSTGAAGSASASTSKLQITSDGRGLSQFTAKAWINMNGTGTIAIRDSHNVSSISDVSTGNYTINLSNTLANTDFSAVSDASNTASYNFFDSWENYSFRTTSRTQIRCYSADTYRDANSVSVVIFGD